MQLIDLVRGEILIPVGFWTSVNAIRVSRLSEVPTILDMTHEIFTVRLQASDNRECIPRSA